MTPTITASPEPTNTNTPVPTNTSTPVLAPTNTPEEADGEFDPEATETVAALLTQQAAAAGGDGATPVPTATALPDTGFADEFGVPGLILIAGVLLVIIILSRRLRTTTG